jgi:dipeptide transport system permease protein
VLRYLLTRLAMAVPTVVGITLIAFVLARLLPGDPVEVMMGDRTLDPAVHQAQLARLGLDQPLPLQYGYYIGRVLHGELGASMVNHRPVIEEFSALFPATIELALCAMLIAVLTGVGIGMLAALRRGGLVDQSLMSLSLIGHSMPIYWSGLLAILFFSVWMREAWPAFALPVSGRIGVQFDVSVHTGFMLIDTLLSDEPGAWRSALRHIILPATVLGTYAMAIIARMTRSSLLEVLERDFVRAARARGLPMWRVIGVHALRSAMIPVITVIGLQSGALLGGAVLTETIFSWPGIGRWLVDAISQRDFTVIQGGVLLISLVVVGVNLLVDMAYGLIDPRIRRQRD